MGSTLCSMEAANGNIGSFAIRLHMVGASDYEPMGASVLVTLYTFLAGYVGLPDLHVL